MLLDFWNICHITCCFRYLSCFSRVVLTVMLFLARGIIAGVFQAAYVYTPEVRPVLHTQSLPFIQEFLKVGSGYKAGFWGTDLVLTCWHYKLSLLWNWCSCMLSRISIHMLSDRVLIFCCFYKIIQSWRPETYSVFTVDLDLPCVSANYRKECCNSVI
jgi:hypothetical protein